MFRRYPIACVRYAGGLAAAASFYNERHMPFQSKSEGSQTMQQYSCPRSRFASCATRDFKLEIVKSMLKSNAVLANLENDELNGLASGSVRQHFIKGSYIEKQGEIGSLLYLLLEGKIDSINESTGERLRTHTHGDDKCFIGELAVFFGERRQTSFVAATDVTVVAVDLKRYVGITRLNQIKSSLVGSLKKWPLFEYMADADLDRIVASAMEEHAEAGVVLYHDGDVQDHMYFILEGSVALSSKSQGTQRQYREHDYFGEMAPLYSAPRAGTATTTAPTRLLKIDRDCLLNGMYGPMWRYVRASGGEPRRASISAMGSKLAKQVSKDECTGDGESRIEHKHSRYQKVVLDVDIGTDIDDTFAIILAHAVKELDVKGITVVGRQSLYRASLAQQIVQRCLGATDIVHAGADVPLYGYQRFNWFGHETSSAMVSDTASHPSTDAVQFLINLYREPSDVVLVALGPLTNIAMAIRQHPEIAKNIPRILVMGGSSDASVLNNKSIHPYADYNLAADPTATLEVFRSGVPLSLFPMAVTLTTAMTHNDVINLSGIVKSDLMRRTIHDLMLWSGIENDLFSALLGKRSHSNHIDYIHDVVPLVYLCKPELFSMETQHIECLEAVDKELDRPCIRTIAHRKRTEWTSPVKVATSVDVVGLKDFVLSSFASFDKVVHRKSQLVHAELAAVNLSTTGSPAGATDAKQLALRRMSAQGPCGVVGFSHINVIVDDIDAATAFYKRVLGFEMGFDDSGPMDYNKVELPAFMRNAGFLDGKGMVSVRFLRHPCGVFLELMHYHSPQGKMMSPEETYSTRGKTNDMGGVRHVALEVEDCQSAFEFLRTQPGVRFINTSRDYCKDGVETLTPFPYKFFYFVDPYGVQWELEEGRPVSCLLGGITSIIPG